MSEGKTNRAIQGCLNTFRFCGYNYIRGTKHNHLRGCGRWEKKNSYANVFLFFIVVHHTPTISISGEVPSRTPAVNSEQISNATLWIRHLRWQAFEETVLENSLPRWLAGSPSPSSVSGDPWSCSCRTQRTWWQEVAPGSPPSAPCPRPLGPLRQHKALFRRLLMRSHWCEIFSVS